LADTTDTIAQVITAQTRGAVAIVRLSGPDSVNIVKKIFKNKNFAKNPESHRIYYGKIVDEKTEIDEVLVSLMLSPKSYTKEDVAEINCHGGPALTQRILAIAIKAGARPAEPGEFTKRAFLNGRIDLSQAEAVCDLINSGAEAARKTAYSQLNGHLKTKITHFREAVLSMTAGIEASLDFPEHELEAVNIKIVSRKAREVLDEINALIQTADYGRLIHNGIETAIAGRPNVGKSSLINAILQRDYAIVTQTPGTTRDILQASVDISGIVLNITDMAGIRDAKDEIERLGVGRAVDYLENAELVLFVLDGSEALTKDDAGIFNLIRGKKAIVVINKNDLKIKIDIKKVRDLAGDMPVVEISAKENTGLEQLYSHINDLFLTEDIATNTEFSIYRQRHTQALKRAAKALKTVLETAAAGMSEDFLTGDLTDAYAALGEITGESLADDIIDKIFNEFCLGK